MEVVVVAAVVLPVQGRVLAGVSVEWTMFEARSVGAVHAVGKNVVPLMCDTRDESEALRKAAVMASTCGLKLYRHSEPCN